MGLDEAQNAPDFANGGQLGPGMANKVLAELANPIRLPCKFLLDPGVQVAGRRLLLAGAWPSLVRRVVI
jgi:hypothetical protein